MSKNILVVGSINMDYVIHTERIPALGETLTGSGFSVNYGGKGANQAIAIAKMGCSVKMLGAVGSDAFGTLAIENLEKYGVSCEGVIKTDAPTGAAMITVCGGDNEIIIDRGANDLVTPNVIDDHRALFEWADVIVMQLEIPAESVILSARLAKDLGKIVILNPAPVCEVDGELYKYVDLIIPNEFEARHITGIEVDSDTAATDAIKALKGLGCKDAIVTLGSRGCAFSVQNEIKFAGIYPVKAVDTTAAGDSFIGGICYKLTDGCAIEDAVKFASAVSAITVSRAGASVSIPTLSEVNDFLSTHQTEA